MNNSRRTISYVFERSRRAHLDSRHLPAELFDKLCPTFSPVCHSPSVAGATAAFNTVERHGLLLALATSSNNMYILSTMRPSGSSQGSAGWSPLASLKPLDETSVLVQSSYHNLHKNWITDVNWVPGDTELLSCSEDGTVSLIDVMTCRKKLSHEMPPSSSAGGTQTRGVCSIRAEPQVCAFGANDCVRLWDRRTTQSVALRGHARTVTQCEATDDGLWLLSSSLDGTVKLWDRRKGICAATLIENTEKDKAVTSVRFNRTETQLLLSSETNRLLLVDWLALTRTHIPHATSSASTSSGGLVVDLNTLPQYHLKSFTGHVNRSYLKKATFSPDDNFLICGSDNGAAMIWSVHSGSIVQQLRAPTGAHATGQLTTALFSPFASATQPCVFTSSDRNFTLWSDTQTAKTDNNISSSSPVSSTPTPSTNAPSSSSPSSSIARPTDLERLEAEYTNRLDMSILDDFEIIEAGGDGEGEEEDEEEEDLFGTEPGVCSYARGYIDQQVFVCLTCTPVDTSSAPTPSSSSSSPAGMCYECMECCHADHNVVTIGKRRRFKCDCGTGALASVPCTLLEGKTANTENVYTDAFRLRYCFCKQPDDGELMVQCTRCCDWFHHHCIGIPNEEDLNTLNMDFLCLSCITGHYPFLSSYPSSVTGGGSTGGDPQLPIMGRVVTQGRFLPVEWRSQLIAAHVHALPEDELEEVTNVTAAAVPNAATASSTASSVSPAAQTVSITSPSPLAIVRPVSSSSSSTSTPTAAPAASAVTSVTPPSRSDLGAAAVEAIAANSNMPPEEQGDLDEQIKAAVMNNDRATAARLLMRQLIGTVASTVKDSRRTNITGEDITRAMTSLEERRRGRPATSSSSFTPAPAASSSSSTPSSSLQNGNGSHKRELSPSVSSDSTEEKTKKPRAEHSSSPSSSTPPVSSTKTEKLADASDVPFEETLSDTEVGSSEMSTNNHNGSS